LVTLLTFALLHDEKFSAVPLTTSSIMKVVISSSPDCFSGPTMALLLKLRFGPSAKIRFLENDASMGNYGLQVSPNAMRVFRTLSLLNAVIKAGARLELGTLARVDQPGTSTRSFLTDPKRLEQRRHPPIGTKRDVLAGVFDLALEKARVARKKARVAAVTQNESGVVVELSDGEVIDDVDLLFACDGPQSRIRSLLHADDTQPTSKMANRLVYAGFSPLASAPTKTSKSLSMALPDAEERVQQQLMVAPIKAVGNWRGSGSQLIHFPVSSDELAWFVTCSADQDSASDINQLTSALQKLNWRPECLDTISAATSLTHTMQYSWRPARPGAFGSGRLFYVGQAAHPGSCPISMDQFISLGIEDAGVLIRALVEHLPANNDLPVAQAAYERVRLARVNYVAQLMSSVSEEGVTAGFVTDIYANATVMARGRYPVVNKVWSYHYAKQLVM